jgi:hypothetical protein
MIDKHTYLPVTATFNCVNYQLKKVAQGTASLIQAYRPFNNASQVTNDFKQLQNLSKSNISKPLFHASINLAEGEGLSDESFLKLANEYLHLLKLDDSPALVFRHYDKKDSAGNVRQHHIHIISTRYHFGGSIAPDSFSKLKINRFLAEKEKVLGFTAASQIAERNYTEKNFKPLYKPFSTLDQQQTYADKRNASKSAFTRRIKASMQKTIQYAFTHIPEFDKACHFLLHHGIRVSLSTNKGGIYGISFTLAPPSSRGNIKYERISSYYGNEKLDKTQIASLKSFGSTSIIGPHGHHYTISLDPDKRIINLSTREQLDKNTGLSFKGSQLNISWNKLKNTIAIPERSEQQLQVAEKVAGLTVDPQTTLSPANRKLFYSTVHRDRHGIYEALAAGAEYNTIQKQLPYNDITTKQFAERTMKELHRKFFSNFAEKFENTILPAYLALRGYKVSEKGTIFHSSHYDHLLDTAVYRLSLSGYQLTRKQWADDGHGKGFEFFRSFYSSVAKGAHEKLDAMFLDKPPLLKPAISAISLFGNDDLKRSLRAYFAARKDKALISYKNLLEKYKNERLANEFIHLLTSNYPDFQQ